MINTIIPIRILAKRSEHKLFISARGTPPILEAPSPWFSTANEIRQRGEISERKRPLIEKVVVYLLHLEGVALSCSRWRTVASGPQAEVLSCQIECFLYVVDVFLGSWKDVSVIDLVAWWQSFPWINRRRDMIETCECGFRRHDLMVSGGRGKCARFGIG